MCLCVCTCVFVEEVGVRRSDCGEGRGVFVFL